MILSRVRRLSPGLLALFACAEAGGLTEPRYGGGDFHAGVTSGGRARTYWLHVPATITAAHAVPLVIVLHGLNQDGKAIRSLSGFDAVADAHGVLVAYLDKARELTPTWSFYGYETGGIDDVQFVKDVIRAVSATFSVDQDRVYAAGYSNGGLFAHQLGCQLRDHLAAVGSVAASLSERIRPLCTSATVVPAVFIHGTADNVFPWNGTPGFMTPPAMLALWAQLNHCATGPIITLLPDVVSDGTTVERHDYTECDRSGRISLYATVGGGHTWPRSAELSSSEAIMSFFAEVRR